MPEPVLSLRHIDKSFAGVQVLAGVSLDVLPGEVHALVGENGAGKSTLFKLCAGSFPPDGGAILVKGQPTPHLDTTQACVLGIATVYAETNLYQELSVAENLAMGHYPLSGRLGMVDWKQMYANAEAILEQLGLQMDVRTRVRDLSPVDRHGVELARAVAPTLPGLALLLLDDPAAGLSRPEAAELLSVVRRLRRRGVGILYISQNLEEALTLADRVSVLRGGQLVDTLFATHTDQGRLVGLMVGRSFDPKEPLPAPAGGAPVLAAANLGRSGLVNRAALTVGWGEVVGLAGLAGAGHSELAKVLFGILPAESGTIVVDGRSAAIDSPRQAMEQGVAYAAGDPLPQSPPLPVAVGCEQARALLEILARYGFFRLQIQEAAPKAPVDSKFMRTFNFNQFVLGLAGGQQKSLVTRWVTCAPRVLILDEPTRGADSATRAAIHGLIRQLAQRGLGILLASTDLAEILELSGRVIVMRKRAVVGEYAPAGAGQAAAIAAAMGLDPRPDRR